MGVCICEYLVHLCEDWAHFCSYMWRLGVHMRVSSSVALQFMFLDKVSHGALSTSFCQTSTSLGLHGQMLVYSLCWQGRERVALWSHWWHRAWPDVGLRLCLSKVRNQVHRKKRWNQIEQREKKFPGDIPQKPWVSCDDDQTLNRESVAISKIQPSLTLSITLKMPCYKTHQVLEELWCAQEVHLGIIHLLVFFENVFTSHFFWTKSWSVFGFICEA